MLQGGPLYLGARKFLVVLDPDLPSCNFFLSTQVLTSEANDPPST